MSWLRQAEDALVILDEIIAHKRTVELPQVLPIDRALLRDLPATRGFRAALARPKGGTVRVIAECKKGSPSKGIFKLSYDPVLFAFQYVVGGASCLSVLTDERFFYGSLTDLERVRAAVALPIIRKDFIIDERQVAQARLSGADAILLIAACLEDGQLRDLAGFARDLALDVLLEVHDEAEAARALDLGADLIGVNNRDLRTFAVSLETTLALVPALVGGGRVVVSESGIHERGQCMTLEAAGVDAVLVGEALMHARWPDAEIKKLRGALA